jgi:hypothetical protein
LIRPTGLTEIRFQSGATVPYSQPSHLLASGDRVGIRSLISLITTMRQLARWRSSAHDTPSVGFLTLPATAC